VALMIGAVFAVRIRNVDENFNEGNLLAFITYQVLIVSGIVVGITVVASNGPAVVVGSWMAGLSLAVFGSMLIFILPKLWQVLSPGASCDPVAYTINRTQVEEGDSASPKHVVSGTRSSLASAPPPPPIGAWQPSTRPSRRSNDASVASGQRTTLTLTLTSPPTLDSGRTVTDTDMPVTLPNSPATDAMIMCDRTDPSTSPTHLRRPTLRISIRVHVVYDLFTFSLLDSPSISDPLVFLLPRSIHSGTAPTSPRNLPYTWSSLVAALTCVHRSCHTVYNNISR
jgi:hypothetical protein